MASLAVSEVLGRPAAAAEVSSPESLNELGLENGWIASRVGLWDVTETVWAKPDAQPVTTTGLVAERVMMGQLQQEFIRPPSDTAHRAIARTDLLSFNRVEGRWKYVSFDTRAPVGLMPAFSTGPGDDKAIELEFEPFAILPPGPASVGELFRMTQVFRFEAPDRDVKDQYFMPSDGRGFRWLGHRYAYQRRA